MYLNLLDIEEFIKYNKLMQVKTSKLPSKSYDKDGLWSEMIFGPYGSKLRSEKFGYVDLKNDYIHPTIFKMITTVSNETSKIVRSADLFVVENKKYVRNEKGETGIGFLLDTIREVDFTLFCHVHKQTEAKFIERNKFKILINKFLIQPAGMRDFNLFSKKKIIDEINDYYSKLLNYISQISGIRELDALIKEKTQIQLNNIVEHIKNSKLKGKPGIFKGSMLKKSMDYTSRLVLCNDPEIKFGEIGLPWSTLIIIYEPFVFFHLSKDKEFSDEFKKYINVKELDFNRFSKFIKQLTKSSNNIPDNIKNGFVTVLNQFLDKQVVMCKRDPVLTRDSWFSAKPIITEGKVAYINSTYLIGLGGDSDGDCVGIFPLFTEESKLEANQKLNPKFAKSKWKTISNYSNVNFYPTHDTISVIFSATEK